MTKEEQIIKTIQRKRCIRGLTQYEEEIDRQMERCEITLEQFNRLNDVFVEQAAKIYNSMGNS